MLITIIIIKFKSIKIKKKKEGIYVIPTLSPLETHSMLHAWWLC